MEFLIAKLPTKNEAYGLTQEKKWPQLSKLAGHYSAFNINNFFFLVPGSVFHLSRTKMILFDGHATIGHHAMSTACGSEKNPKTLETYFRNKRQNLGLDVPVSGVFCAGEIHTDTGAFTLILDPLSQYNLFHFNGQATQVFSNNIYCVEKIMSLIGQPNTRSIFNAASEAAVGVSGHLTTGLDEIQLTPPDHYVTGNATRNQVALIRSHQLSSTTPSNAFGTANSLATSLNAIHHSFNDHDIVYDLTGGIDSRVVFGASRHAGLRQQLIFSNENSAPYDTLIPNLIAKKYSLKRAGYQHNFNGESVTSQQLAKRAVFRQQGQATTYNYALGRNRVTGLCRIRGGVGEIMRTMYSIRGQKSLKWKLKHFLASHKPENTVDRIHFFKPRRKRLFSVDADLSLMALLFTYRIKGKAEAFTIEFQRVIYEQTLHTLETMAGLGLENNQLFNGLYLSSRSRRHFGYTSQMFNQIRPSFEPLANIDLWRFSNSHDFEQRKNGDVIFSLLNIMEKELLTVPLQAPSLINSSWDFNLFTGACPSAPEPPLAKTKHCPGPRMVDPDNNNCYSGHAANMYPNMSLFFELLFALDQNHMIWTMINKNYFEKLYASGAYEETLTSDGLFLRLLYGLIWVHKLEEIAPISSTY